ncbi:MAG: tol-pal system protein YbgF [Longimicrobiales bacterium]
MLQRPLLIALALVLPLTACATKRDLRDLQSEVRALSLRQDSAFLAIQRMNRVSQDSLSVYSDVLFQLRGDLNNQLLNIQDQLIQLGELAGQSQRSLAGMRDQLEDQRRQASQPPPRPTGGTPGQGDVIPGATGAGEPAEAYNVAATQYNRGNYSVATLAFRRFLQDFPDHELAPSAHLRLGEMLESESRLEEAALEYLEVRRLFPTSEAVPDALFRAGAVYLEMENFDLARQYLEQVVNTYPDHPIASLAEERLQDIP